jgi:tetratricopeptide (TPR) repeat protein
MAGMAGFPLVVLVAQLVGGSSWGTRPRDCAHVPAATTNVWERAKGSELSRYCSWMASGLSRLSSSGGSALDVLSASEEALKVRPGDPFASVLKARALERLGRFGEAVALFATAVSKDPRCLDEPAAALAWARSLARTGQTSKAIAVYREALPRATQVTSEVRGQSSFDAGLLAMELGPAGLPEAIAFFRAARRAGGHAYADAAGLALALALYRSGAVDQAKATLREMPQRDPRASLGALARQWNHVQFARESHAMAALLLEAIEPDEAGKAWAHYMEAGGRSGPWGSSQGRGLGGGKKGEARPGREEPSP